MNMRWITAAIVMLCALSVRASEPKAGDDGRFEKLKTLVGEWRGMEGDKPVQVSYKLISDDSTLMETLSMHGGMVSMYHMDGANLLMTHYCAMHNQPRMRAEQAKGADNTLSFDFIDATNMADANAMHMHHLVLTFVDADHFTQDWTLWVEGKAGKTVTFKFERVK